MRTVASKRYHGAEVLEIMAEVNFKDNYELNYGAEVDLEIEEGEPPRAA